MKIPVYAPFLDEREGAYVADAISRGELSGAGGTYLRKFEADFSKYSECSYGVAVNSGTTALHLAVATLGIGEGDEILIPSFTSMASFFAALYERAKPIPVDMEPDTWNMDPDDIEGKIGKKTKAIMVVHIYGHPADMKPILRIARKHDLLVIEDCAEAPGALYNGRKVGSFGDAACFSFYGNKIVTTGEGGMLTTNDSEIADRARLLSNLAFGERKKFMHRAVGFKYPMTNVQAAIGCAQLEKIEETIRRKREIARLYTEALRDIPGLQLPVEKSYARNVYWMYHVVVDEAKFGTGRDAIMRRLMAMGIETRPAFVPYTGQEIFIRKKMANPRDCPVSNSVGERGFYLPSGPSLTPEQVAFVAGKLARLKREPPMVAR